MCGCMHGFWWVSGVSGRSVGRSVLFGQGKVWGVPRIGRTPRVVTNLLVLQAALCVGDELDVLAGEGHQLAVACPQRHVLGETFQHAPHSAGGPLRRSFLTFWGQRPATTDALIRLKVVGCDDEKT